MEGGDGSQPVMLRPYSFLAKGSGITPDRTPGGCIFVAGINPQVGHKQRECCAGSLTPELPSLSLGIVQECSGSQKSSQSLPLQ